MIDPRFAKLPHEPRSICPPWSYWTSKPENRPTDLPSWITETVWESLIIARRRMDDVEPGIATIARGPSGFGDDAGPED